MLPQGPVDAANEAAQPCIQAIPALWMGGSREHVAQESPLRFVFAGLYMFLYQERDYRKVGSALHKT